MTTDEEQNSPREAGNDPRTPGRPKGVRIMLRDVAPGEAARQLRALVGLPPGEPVPGEHVAWVRATMPVGLERVDVFAWIVWCLAGLDLFAREFPTAARLRLASRHIVYGLVLHRSRCNISETARVLGISRKVLRDNLRALGLYPLARAQCDGQDDAPVGPHGDDDRR